MVSVSPVDHSNGDESNSCGVSEGMEDESDDSESELEN